MLRARRSASRPGATSSRRRLIVEGLEPRRLLAGLPYGAHADDTAEFMLGRVVVTPVFLESDGRIDPSTEDWTSEHINHTLDKINEALDWWVLSLQQLNTVHELTFVVDTTFALDPAPTAYEPINRRSNDFVFYVNEFLQSQGAATTNIEREIRAFNHAQRERFEADWSFTMFVVNSHNQGDGQFAPGGSFSRAFAFAGGLFMVVPSTRPASTFAHETGHMFWARDEYPGGGTYYSYRGYYNSPNANAWDNPSPGFVQQPSIMAAGTLLDSAYLNFTSAAATFAQIGWQDSDGNGIFDVLDVPSKLEGSGYWDPLSQLYHFAGRATVQTLPNRNSSGLKNDITLNRIGEIQYRFDGGPWQLWTAPNAYQVELELAIPVPPGASEIQIRARDPATTVTSNLFTGRLDRADATAAPGINGFVWLDHNANGLRDVGELGQAGWTVTLVDGNGQPLQLGRTVEPDQFSAGPLGSQPIHGVLLTSIGDDVDGRVGVASDSAASTGGKLFTAYSISSQSFVSTWTTTGRRLQASFIEPTTRVAIDAIGTGAAAYGRLEAFSAEGQLLARFTTGPLAAGQVATMSIERGAAEIAYVIASGTARTSIKLDNLRYGPESSTVTDPLGGYRFSSLPAGDYLVRVTPPDGWVALNPQGGLQMTQVLTQASTIDVDFGFSQLLNPWQNPLNAYDVNDDGRVSALDALQVINAINLQGVGELGGASPQAPPYIDVNGDGRLTALDALLVINVLNTIRTGDGEAAVGQPGVPQVPIGGGSAQAEGESAVPLRSTLGSFCRQEFPAGFGASRQTTPEVGLTGAGMGASWLEEDEDGEHEHDHELVLLLAQARLDANLKGGMF